MDRVLIIVLLLSFYFQAADLEAKIAKLQQENKCHIHNAEATKQGLESKLKQQEKELKNEVSQAQNTVNSLTKEMEETKKQLTQDKNAARQAENTMKAQLEKFEAEKRYVESFVYYLLYLPYYPFPHIYTISFPSLLYSFPFPYL